MIYKYNFLADLGAVWDFSKKVQFFIGGRRVPAGCQAVTLALTFFRNYRGWLGEPNTVRQLLLRAIKQ
jgi:hypothetical protein